MSMKKLTDKLAEDLAKIEQAARREHSTKEKLAQLWDSHIEATPAAAECVQPWFLHTSKVYGAIGSFCFKDATPEDCNALLYAFEPVPLALVRADSCTSARPADYAKEGEKIESAKPIEGGAVLRLSRVQSYPQKLQVDWYTRLSGELVSMSVELVNVHGITPTYDANVQYDPTQQFVVAVRDARPGYHLKPAQALSHIRYSAGSSSGFGDLLIYGNVRAYIEQLAGYCYSKRIASKKAYQQDKIEGLPPVSGPASDQTYDRQSLRAGTREQHECLVSEAARRDRALAEKHWKEYAADYGIEVPSYSSSQSFDHYAWAVAYLKRARLYEVSDPRNPEKTYKYGHAWL